MYIKTLNEKDNLQENTEEPYEELENIPTNDDDGKEEEKIKKVKTMNKKMKRKRKKG